MPNGKPLEIKDYAVACLKTKVFPGCLQRRAKKGPALMTCVGGLMGSSKFINLSISIKTNFPSEFQLSYSQEVAKSTLKTHPLIICHNR